MSATYRPSLRLQELLLTLLLAGLFASWPSLARERLLIGVENQPYLPIHAFDRGQYLGFARELLDAWAKARGYQVEYVALPVPRLYAAFFAGRVDFKFPDNPNWKRTSRTGKKLVYSEPVLAFVDGTCVLPQRRQRGVESVKVLGTLGGFTPWAWRDRIQAGQTLLSENYDLQALTQQALAGRVDGIYASVAVINHQLNHVLKRPGALLFDPSLPHSRDHYYLSSLKRPDLIRDFNAWMRNNRAWIDQLKARHEVEEE